ncbi:MAG: hypothetical protein ACFFCS_09935 [Candidatus Hodarchaeota archaeon]
MKLKKKAMIFFIMIIGVFAIPMVYLIHPWGNQIGWIWGFSTQLTVPGDIPQFEWTWQMLQNVASGSNPIYILEVVAIICLFVALALMVLAIMMNSNKRVVISASTILAAYGVIVIIGMAAYNASAVAISVAYTPLGIFLPACSGTAIVVEIVGSRRNGNTAINEKSSP